MNDTHVNQWVPVSERLPGLYLGSTSKKLVLLNDGCVRVAYLNGERWRDPHASAFIPETVTHWMDLPEPPEPPKPADPFEAWWDQYCNTVCCSQNDARRAWDASKEHYAKPKDYHRGLEDSVIAFESMVNRIMEGKDDGIGTLEIPQLEKLRRVLLGRLKPLPDFETWAKAHWADGPYLEVGKGLISERAARIVWNAAQGKPEA